MRPAPNKAGSRFWTSIRFAPNAKRENARTVEASGAHYVESCCNGACIAAAIEGFRCCFRAAFNARELAERLRSIRHEIRPQCPTRSESPSGDKNVPEHHYQGNGSADDRMSIRGRAATRWTRPCSLSLQNASFPSLGWNGRPPEITWSVEFAEHGRRRAAEMA